MSASNLLRFPAPDVSIQERENHEDRVRRAVIILRKVGVSSATLNTFGALPWWQLRRSVGGRPFGEDTMRDIRAALKRAEEEIG